MYQSDEILHPLESCLFLLPELSVKGFQKRLYVVLTTGESIKDSGERSQRVQITTVNTTLVGGSDGYR